MACKRCNNEGMSGHRHVAGGVCFECGRLPGGEGAARERPVCSARERCILDIQTLLRRAEQERARGMLREWWADAAGDPDSTVRARVMTAPADVRERALAAFKRAGLSLDGTVQE